MGVFLRMSYERKRWHTHVFTSTYTADVSGVCSAMYELGGMTILHDPSGCNSTYTTHDEPRWYDSKSLMFVSGLDEMTAVMGDDSVLIRDAVRAAADLKPRFITLCGASIPHIISFDFKGVARLIERETGIPVLPVSAPISPAQASPSASGSADSGTRKTQVGKMLGKKTRAWRSVSDNTA